MKLIKLTALVSILTFSGSVLANPEPRTAPEPKPAEQLTFEGNSVKESLLTLGGVEMTKEALLTAGLFTGLAIAIVSSDSNNTTTTVTNE